MKKHTFMESTLIATICLIIVKFLGLIYVIPFYAIIGEKGAALYAYAYTIYGMFLDISTAGIPNAIGKLINEFHTLGQEEAKIRTFKLGKRMLGVIAVISFIIMFIFAKPIATIIIGDLKGGNTIQDVAFVIRCISFSLLLFPFLSVTRGFFQGHKYIYVNCFSQVIEQVARVFFIIVGSYVALKCLGLGTTNAVGVAVFSAFIGGTFALGYIYDKMRKNKKELGLDTKFIKNDDISNKTIFKRILAYAIPTVIISISFSIYGSIDMILILRTMNHLGFSPAEVEFIPTAMSTWASKISIIMLSVGAGLMASLGPSVVESYTLKKYDDVNRHFNRTMGLTLFITVPMCIGISLLSESIWTVFYGYNKLGATILSVTIFSALFINLFNIGSSTLQSISRFKMVYISSITGIVINTLLDVPLMLLCHKIGLPAYWGATFSTIIGLSISIVFVLVTLKKELNCKFKYIVDVMKKMSIPLIVMIIVVVLLKLLIPINMNNRFMCILYIGIVSIVGAIVYFFISSKIGLLDKVLGKDFLDKLKNKFKKRLKKEVMKDGES